MRTPLPFLPVSVFGFVLFGALLVLVGSSQDELRAALSLNLADTGLLASAVVLGIGAGVLLGGPLVDRLPRRPLFSLAAAGSGLALWAVEPGASFPRTAALMGIAGLGAGVYETVLNAAAVERYAERSVRTLTLMHSGATLGAMLTPFGVGALLAAGDWTLAFRIVGAGHGLLALVALAAPLDATPAAAPEAGGARRVWSPPLFFLLVAAFAYVGVESSITAFAVPYADTALGIGADRGRSAIGVFWLGLLLGRLAFAMRALLGAEVDDARPAAFAGGLAGVTIAAAVALGWTQIEILLGVVGFALGGVFPLLVALAGRRTPHATGAGIAVVSGLGSAGGFVTPWATGLVGDAAGIAVGIGTLAAWCALCAASALLADASHRRRAAIRG